MGLGFIIGGFCPGTSLSAAATGKVDAIVFIGGVLLGVFGFIFTYESVWETLRKSGNMGKINIAEWIGIKEGVFILLFAIIAIATFVVFQKWQDSWKKKMSQEDIDDLGI